MAGGGKRRAASKSRNSKVPTKDNPNITDPDITNDEEFEDLEESAKRQVEILQSSDLPESASNELKDILARSEMLDAGFTATLYKYDNEVTGMNKSMVAQWYESLLSEHEVGLKYGSGRYLVLVRANDKKGKRKIKAVSFRINRSYDELRQQQKALNDNPIMAAAASLKGDGGGGMNNLLLTISLMEKMMDIFRPLIEKGANTGTGGINQVLIDSYKNTGLLLKEMMMDNLQLINDIQRNAAGVSEVYEDESEVSGIQGFIKTFAPILEKFIPIITGTGVQSKNTIDALKATPQYKKIIKSTKDLKLLINYMDGKHGVKQTDEVLKKLKLSRP